MRLRVISTARGPRLHAELDGGLADLGDAVARSGCNWPEHVADAGAYFEAGPDLQRVAAAAVAAHGAELALEGAPPTSLPPVARPSKVICVGLNYARHAAESGSPIPAQPLLFAKFPSSVIGDGEAVHKPSVTAELDYEGELAVIIGRHAQRVSEQDALDVVGGYTIMNDVSARDLQMREPQWIRAKALDTFAPLGPAVLTADEVSDIGSLRLTTRVNGECRQDSLCADMIFTVPQIIAFVSQCVTLLPGDVIATGTPAGVGFGFKPPRYLNAGDMVEVTISGIGTLRSPIVDAQEER